MFHILPFLSVVDSYNLWLGRIRKGHQLNLLPNGENSIQHPEWEDVTHICMKTSRDGEISSFKKHYVFSFFFSGFINLLVPTYLPLPKTNQNITKRATTTPTLSYTFKDTLLSTLQCSLGLSLAGLSYNKMIPSPPQYWRNYRVFSSDLRDTLLFLVVFTYFCTLTRAHWCASQRSLCPTQPC